MEFFCTVPRPHFLGRVLIWPSCFGERILGLFGLYSSSLSKSVGFVSLSFFTNTVILLEPYCGTITEPGLPVEAIYASRWSAKVRIHSTRAFV